MYVLNKNYEFSWSTDFSMRVSMKLCNQFKAKFTHKMKKLVSLVLGLKVY